MKALRVTKKELGIRDQIAALELEVGQAPQMTFPVKHTFADGVYCREISIPAGVVIVGKIHRHEHFNFVAKGKVTVLTKDGRETITGPRMLISGVGTKRALLTHEDTTWFTMHANPTNERDITKLEASIIAPDYADIDGGGE